MKRTALLIALLSPCLMCFQCGCDDYNTLTKSHIESTLEENLYWTFSQDDYLNARCNLHRIPSKMGSEDGALSAVEMVRRQGGRYLMLVNEELEIVKLWNLQDDTLHLCPLLDEKQWVSDTTVEPRTNCNGITPTLYTHVFTLRPEHLQ